jgi:putative CocE/NonD family hydrolase
MHAGDWRSGAQTPEGEAESVFYLHPDGLLSAEAPKQEAPGRRARHDPDHPVPTSGGNILMSGFPAGSFDQQDIQARSDVLVYTGAPLQSDWEMLGTVQAHLRMTLSRPGLPIGLRISDVKPDGSAWNVVDTVQAGEHTIDIGRTAYRFSAGNRLRLEIYLSSFPRIESGTSPDWAKIHGTSQLHVSAGTSPVFQD